jgi:hypothetical protein
MMRSMQEVQTDERPIKALRAQVERESAAKESAKDRCVSVVVYLLRSAYLHSIVCAHNTAHSEASGTCDLV